MRHPLVALIASLALVALACSSGDSLPAGEVYRTADQDLELTVREDHQVEYSEDAQRLLGTYSIEDDGRVRVVVEHLGTQHVLYFQHDPEVGLIAEDGKVLYNSEQAKAHVDHAQAQIETMATLRNVGTAMMAWLIESVGAASAGQDVEEWPLLPSAEVRSVLVPNYLSELPLQDGWGNDLEYRLDVDDPTAERVMLVRSPGSDGELDDSYQSGPFDPGEHTRDIVWADGYFLSWPEGR